MIPPVPIDHIPVEYRATADAKEEEARAPGLTQTQVDAFFDAVPDAALFNAAELAVIAFNDQMVLTNPDGILDHACTISCDAASTASRSSR